jgi:AcrB/AcrD/AcrF family protein
MIVAALLAITLDPAMRLVFTHMANFRFRPRWRARATSAVLVGKIHSEESHPISRVRMRLYEPAVKWSLRWKWAYQRLGSEFMPPLDEGALLFMPTTLPGISVTQAQKLLQLQDRILMRFPEVARVMGKAGRAESSTDPAPLSMMETIVLLKPKSQWRKAATWYDRWPEWTKPLCRRVTLDHISTDDLTTEMNEALRMALTGKKTGRVGALALVAAAAVWGDTRFEVRQEHLRKGCYGVMTVDDQGVYFHGQKGHAWAWKYQDIQELKLGPARIHLTTYWDNKFKLSADRKYEFTGKMPAELYRLGKERLDQRFVAEMADEAEKPVWQVPAKHLGRISGSEGVLEIGADRIVYASGSKGESRAWRFRDIGNISSSGPIQLTITTFERAKFHYGDRKDFNFQLKETLSEARYNELWRKLEDQRRTP